MRTIFVNMKYFGNNVLGFWIRFKTVYVEFFV